MKLRMPLLIASVAAALTFGATAAQAAKPINVLVIDSGSDFTHKALNPLARANKAELNGVANVDDDNNGYVDDVYGWNFVENNNTIVNLEDTPPEYDRVLKVMEYLGKLQQSGQEAFSQEEWAWLAKNYNDKKLQPWINFCGGWAHGTHCAGIIATDNKGVALNAVRHIPTGSAPKGIILNILKKITFMLIQKFNKVEVTPEMLEEYFNSMKVEMINEVKAQADYIAKFNPRLINCSFGSENSQIFQMIKQSMKQWNMKDLSDEAVQKMVNTFVTKVFLERDKALFSGCKNALIFIAAGNSSENLDGFVTSPNNVPIPNKIVIGATDEDQKLADFSCYGVKTVDVAVPGVNIYATYPNNKFGYMSGTSMACPNALRMASLVLQENPNLTPVELKKILMGTVDVKEWLKDKVRTSGVINVDRAIYAAKQMKNGKSLKEAIEISRAKVEDKPVKRGSRTKPNLKDPMIRKMYYSNVF